MKIVVISDTHIPVAADGIPRKIREQIKDCDFTVHAGDVTEMYVIEELRHFAETYAVRGNMDSPEVKKALPEKLIFEANEKIIGIVHGHGPFSNAIEAARKAFKGKTPDVVIFGHSHLPFSEVIGNTLFFNPGSVSDRMFSPYR